MTERDDRKILIPAWVGTKLAEYLRARVADYEEGEQGRKWREMVDANDAVFGDTGLSKAVPALEILARMISPAPGGDAIVVDDEYTAPRAGVENAFLRSLRDEQRRTIAALEAERDAAVAEAREWREKWSWEATRHAHCLSIADGAPGWDTRAVALDSPAMAAVGKLRAEVERLKDDSGLPSIAEMEADGARIDAMTDDEIAAELVRAGLDPEEVARDGRKFARLALALHDAHVETDRLRAVLDEALDVLAPSMRESGLVDACRQRMQAYISTKDNFDEIERRYNRLCAVLRGEDYPAVLAVRNRLGKRYFPQWQDEPTPTQPQTDECIAILRAAGRAVGVGEE